jgi:hypothetical protein
MPRLALTLEHGDYGVGVSGLVDSGSTVNVLPYSIGLALGAVWEEQPVIPPLAGNLSQVEVRALSVVTHHPQLTLNESIHLVFAWVQSDDAPVILGQINFFLEFDVCFYRSQNVFEIKLKRGLAPREAE